MNHIPRNYPVDVVFDQTKMEQIDVRFLLKHVLGVQDDTIPAVSFSYAVIAQFLYASPFLTPSVWQALLRRMDVSLQVASRGHAAWLKPTTKSLKKAPHGLYQVIFIDGQWATWTGEPGFMDLQTGEIQEVLQVPGVEQVAYNLTELTRREYLRCLALLEKRGVIPFRGLKQNRRSRDACDQSAVRAAKAARGVD